MVNSLDKIELECFNCGKKISNEHFNIMLPKKDKLISCDDCCRIGEQDSRWNCIYGSEHYGYDGIINRFKYRKCTNPNMKDLPVCITYTNNGCKCYRPISRIKAFFKILFGVTL